MKLTENANMALFSGSLARYPNTKVEPEFVNSRNEDIFVPAHANTARPTDHLWNSQVQNSEHYRGPIRPTMEQSREQ